MTERPTSPAARAAGGTRNRLIGVLSFVIVVVVAVIVGGVIWSHSQPAGDTGPVAVGAAPAPGAGGKNCTALMTALPAQLAGSARREVIGSPTGVAAWGDPAITLRCGLPTPQELTCSAGLVQLSNANGQPGVLWLQQSEGGQTTYLAADRPVRIAVTLPDNAGTGPIQELSSVISGVLPSTADAQGHICTDGTLHPTVDG
ncbi:DUF3515 domain-containing protein [Nakamurella lactea]|uniref:DUF3515 domain-containing protein n=1 Tax=Nakamurella lactea TaxID=459515 RepID=UPI000412C57D|nr:DUF3515 domain-containing protein [Nakamurella lactea]